MIYKSWGSVTSISVRLLYRNALKANTLLVYRLVYRVKIKQGRKLLPRNAAFSSTTTTAFKYQYAVYRFTASWV